MPRIGLTSDNKAKSAFDYPKIYLDKGERARIVAIEAEPLFEFVHVLRSVSLVDGKVVMEEVSQFGKLVTKPKYDFVGRHICIGDYEAIKLKGVDPKGCPVCKASTETDAVSAPERRFAMHVVRYATKPGSYEVQDPFSVAIQAWAFGNKVFDQIVDFAKEWGDLKTHDLLLGPCESKQWQRFEVQVAARAEWLASDERKKLVAATYKENQSTDLTSLIGRKLSREMIEDDLEKVLAAHRIGFGRGTPTTDVSDVSSAVDLDGLLGDETESNKATTEASSDLDDLLGERAEQGADATPQSPSQPGPVDPEGDKQAESQPGAPDQNPKSEGEEFDLDDLLADV